MVPDRKHDLTADPSGPESGPANRRGPIMILSIQVPDWALLPELTLKPRLVGSHVWFSVLRARRLDELSRVGIFLMAAQLATMFFEILVMHRSIQGLDAALPRTLRARTLLRQGCLFYFKERL
jgi:hypothetical protein